MAVKKDEKTKKWYFYGKHADGKQYKRRGFDTKKTAQIAEMKYREDYEQQSKEPTVLFADVIREYLDWYEARHKFSSYTKIESVTRVHLEPVYGIIPAKDVTASHVMDHQTDLIARGYSGAMLDKIHTVLSSACKFAIRKGYMDTNPAAVAGGANVAKNKVVNYWTLEEFRQFIASVDDQMHYALFMTLYYSGMRKGELRALTWADLDFDNNTIDVNKTEYKRTVQTPKTPTSIRIIHMPGHVMSLLRRFKATQKPKASYAVFSRDVISISETHLSKIFNQYIKKSGVKKIRLHDIRHSHASYLINKGMIISVVAARLGHGNVSETLNTYSHLFPSTEKEAVNAMEDDFKTAKIIKLQAK